MRGFEEAIRSDMKLEKRMMKIIRQEMKVLPEGWLRQGGGGRSVYENGKQSLPPDGPRTLAIARRNLLKRKLQTIEENLKAQEILLKKYKSYRDDKVLKQMRPVYQRILGTAWTVAARQRQEARLAAQQQSIESGTAFHPEHLKHKGKNGQLNRSKSEIIIGNLYETLKIPCDYEERVYWPKNAPPEAWAMKQALKIPDYYVSDFTCTMPDGTKKHHEHLGMMDSADYMENWKKKMILYFWAGIIPGKNLIITADDCHGGIDQQAIMHVLQAEFGELIGTAL